MAGEWNEEEMDALRGAIAHLDGMAALAEEWKGWGLPAEVLEEARHALTARFGHLALAMEGGERAGSK